MHRPFAVLALAALSASIPAQAAETKKPEKPAAEKADKADKTEKKGPWSADSFSGLAFRPIGPAVTEGRIADFAVVPGRPATWYVAVASGGVWKTTNAGTSWTPLFDGQTSYSIGCLTLDPKDPLTIWVGTGENNSQRSVAYGDGVYRSVDGGKSWEAMGLKTSEHIGRIVVDPRDSKVVWVAAQGPLWASGGERGLYRTADGGKTWRQVLKISDDTGVNEVWLDPRNPDVVLATSYQRRRHVWTLIDGGPESAIHKSTDAGATWKKIEKGLPKGDLGRIGLAVAPSQPDVVYAIVEASGAKDKGVYRSTDFGWTWERRGDHLSSSPQYYQELVVDPQRPERVYSLDTFLMVSDDAGKTFRRAGEKYKHVDNHALWIDPEDSDHLVNGNDGGMYESWDRAATWHFKANLNVTQFYRVSVDESLPFYNVCGGTQDNNSLCGPSRTRNASGIVNADWFVTQGGDGFVTRADPKDPNTVYAESQHGGLVRFDRRTGERVDIQPQPGKDEPAIKLNWDTPLVISPHAHTRLYVAGQQVFRSDDRGDSWVAISGDLTAKVDRNKLKVMGRVWSVDTVAKNASTSFYGSIVALAESPLAEGLLVAGTDDGLIQITEDGGKGWRKVDAFPGVPAGTLVNDVEPSAFSADVIYATFDDHQKGSFKPYVLKSADRGRTWASISGDLPERGTAYCVAEDPTRAGLLYVGTEFGVFFSPDDGKRWVQLKGGLPPIQVRDLAIQAREGDLVLATFGRGFYVLDDLTPVRKATAELLEKEATLFPVKKAWMFVPAEPLGGREKAFQGEGFFSAPNPPFGAVFTYHLKDELKTRKKARQEAEKKIADKGGDVAYPSWDDLRAEGREEDPSVILTVTDSEGKVVRRLAGPTGKGMQRIAWNLRFPPANPTELKPPAEENPFANPPEGPMAVPGTYTVSLARRVDGVLTTLGEPQTFTAEPLGLVDVPAAKRGEILAFQRKAARLQRAVLGANETVKEAQTRLDHLKKALVDAPGADLKLLDEARAIQSRLADLKTAMTGDPVARKYNEPAAPSITERVNQVVEGCWEATTGPTGTHRQQADLAGALFQDALGKLQTLVEKDLKGLEERAETAGAPWTPGRVPRWKPE